MLFLGMHCLAETVDLARRASHTLYCNQPSVTETDRDGV
jgi:hypothetical protein